MPVSPTRTGYPHEGRIDFAAISVDPSTGTLLVRAVFPNPDRAMLPGLFVRVRVPIGRRAATPSWFRRSRSASTSIGRYVLVVNDKNVVERRGVRSASRSATMRVIDDGLNGDERVVVNGLLRAIPGREVSPETSTAQPRPPRRS